jgi:hypothetical protein
MRGVPARVLPSAQQSAPAESQGAREVWLARATSVRATRSGRRASGRPVTLCSAPPARDHALPQRAQRRAHVLVAVPLRVALEGLLRDPGLLERGARVAKHLLHLLHLAGNRPLPRLGARVTSQCKSYWPV